MDTRAKTLLSWSSGKDSAWTLHVLRSQGVNVAGLVTTVNAAMERVAMHAVRVPLLEAQAAAAGLPLVRVDLPWPCSNEEYEARFAAALARARAAGFTQIAFGDLFLEDIRAYREKQLEGTGFSLLFPLWQLPTDRLARDMIAGGLKARLTCVDPKHLDRSFAGREFDVALLDALPRGVDPCGERGEFHSFAYGGPMFEKPIAILSGEVVERDGFVFADIFPA